MNKLLSDFGKKLIYGFGFGMGMGISFIILKKIDPEEKQFNQKLNLTSKNKLQNKLQKKENIYVNRNKLHNIEDNHNIKDNHNTQNEALFTLEEIDKMYIP